MCLWSCMTNRYVMDKFTLLWVKILFLYRALKSSLTYDTFTVTQEQQPFSFVAPTPFSHFIPLPLVRELGAEVWEAWQTATPTSRQSGDWWMGHGGRGLEVNYRQQRGHGAYYFGAGTCNGPMGMAFTTRAWPHPSITIHTRSPTPRTPSLTSILKEPTVGLSGLIMKRPTGVMMNRPPGCSPAASGGLQVAHDC